MAQLLLNDDELALLRFTCDLFFTPESPVYYIEQSCREPSDFGVPYRSLLEKKALDAKTFRLTDMALNRLAPLTECDARIVVTRERPGREASVSDYYLLDEIAVHYQEQADGHGVGPDLDHEQLLGHFFKLFSPRRSRGDFVEVELTPGEYLVFALLAQDVRKSGGERMGLAEIIDALTDLGISTSDPEAAAGPTGGPVHPYAVRHKGAQPATGLAARSTADEETAVARPQSFQSSLPSDPRWEAHLLQLELKGVIGRDKRGHALLRPTFAELARALAERGRVSFVRYDFVDDEWLIRETTFLPVEGGLFFLGPTPEGAIGVRELDATRLDLALRAAVGPLPPGVDAPVAAKKARDFLLRA
ncbi:MAG: hypothetical protein JXR83_06170 [Deltaproteobacteria bacterium]|nr:hypothetical protein [Deltaproteobacteria bacterium]